MISTTKFKVGSLVKWKTTQALSWYGLVLRTRDCKYFHNLDIYWFDDETIHGITSNDFHKLVLIS